MIQPGSISRYTSRPASFWYFLQDALVVHGLPYGPQARQRIAHAHPDLFGRSDSTLRGYERWLARSSIGDTCEAFARFMDERYKRWRLASIVTGLAGQADGHQLVGVQDEVH